MANQEWDQSEQYCGVSSELLEREFLLERAKRLKSMWEVTRKCAIPASSKCTGVLSSAMMVEQNEWSTSTANVCGMSERQD